METQEKTLKKMLKKKPCCALDVVQLPLIRYNIISLFHSQERPGKRELKFGKTCVLLISSILAMTAAVSPASDLSLSGLDRLGRARTASAVLGPQTIPDKDRLPISMFYPSGFRPNVKYDFIDGSGHHGRYT